VYDYFEGRLVTRRPTSVVIDVGGVGFDIAVPLGVHFPPVASGSAAGDMERVRVWTHLALREDAQDLYGFPTTQMRELFRLLLKVRGVGPGLALAVLSSLPGEELLEAIANADLAALTRVKGVGKKTAEQLLLDLRDRAPQPSASQGAASRGAAGTLQPRPPRDPLVEDAQQALVSIGFSDKDAQKSVAKAAEKVGTEDLEVLVLTALRG